MVKQSLAKAQLRVRFSLPAPISKIVAPDVPISQLERLAYFIGLKPERTVRRLC